MKIQTAGENALIVYLGEHIDPLLADKVQQAAVALRPELNQQIIDLVPSYASLLVIFDPLRHSHTQIRQLITKRLNTYSSHTEEPGKLVTIPVYYSEESGPDLSAIATRTGLGIEEIIALHQNREYRVYAIGFAPGFAYLGEVDERLASPRLATPRTQVPQGAVGIADRQTAVYPAASPGGWNLIGLCPTLMFDPEAEPHMPVAVGDRVRFQAIARTEFLQLGGEL